MDEHGGGDERIFRDLYPRLRRFAAVVGPPEEDPEDLVQDALVRTLRHHGLAELDNAERYLQTVVVRLASNRRRSLGYARRLLRRLDPPLASTTSFPSDLAELYRLQPEVRAVLYLVEVEGWSFREAALVAGCSEDAARARASRGLRQLRLQLSEEPT
jgi:RNA polymerase sigma-70 factor (ECF subfamily)